MRFQNLLVLAFIQTLAIHKEIGALQRQGSIARHADGVPVVIGRGAGPRHVNIHILEGEIGTPERDTKDLGLAVFRYELQLGLDGGFFLGTAVSCCCDRLRSAFDRQFFVLEIDTGGSGIFDHFNGVAVIRFADSFVKARILGGSGGSAVLTGNGGNSVVLRRSGGRSSGRSRSWCQRGSHQHRSLCCRRFCKDFILNGSILLVLVGSFLLGLASGLLLGFVSGLLLGLVSGLLLGLVSGLLLGLVSGLLLGLLLGLVSGLLLGLVSGLLLGLVSGLLLGLVSGLLLGLVSGLLLDSSVDSFLDSLVDSFLTRQWTPS